MAIAARAAEMRAAGEDVISLSAGEPDFDTPDSIAEAGIEAIRNGDTHYTAAAGTPSLRKIVAQSVSRDVGVEYAPDEVIISAGTKPAISLALYVLLEPGEEVVVLAPYWVSYPAMVTIAGGKPRIVACSEEQGFLPTADELEAALGAPNVRGIIINSPANPSGAVWPENRMAQLVEICNRHDRWILSDEIYADLVYDGTKAVSPAGFPGARDRTLVMNGLSKSYAMTGWRLGWLAGPRDVVAAINRVQSQCIGNPCSISQSAAEQALTPATREAVDSMLAAFRQRREFLVPALQGMPGMTLDPPSGAFYAFPGVAALCARHNCDDVELVRRILEETGVAVVPGSAFGLPGHIRFSFAASLENIEEAVARIRKWIGDSP